MSVLGAVQLYRVSAKKSNVSHAMAADLRVMHATSHLARAHRAGMATREPFFLSPKSAPTPKDFRVSVTAVSQRRLAEGCLPRIQWSDGTTMDGSDPVAIHWILVPHARRKAIQMHARRRWNEQTTERDRYMGKYRTNDSRNKNKKSVGSESRNERKNHRQKQS